jgi:hypothetical protein
MTTIEEMKRDVAAIVKASCKPFPVWSVSMQFISDPNGSATWYRVAIPGFIRIENDDYNLLLVKLTDKLQLDTIMIRKSLN